MQCILELPTRVKNLRRLAIKDPEMFEKSGQVNFNGAENLLVVFFSSKRWLLCLLSLHVSYPFSALCKNIPYTLLYCSSRSRRRPLFTRKPTIPDRDVHYSTRQTTWNQCHGNQRHLYSCCRSARNVFRNLLQSI